MLVQEEDCQDDLFYRDSEIVLGFVYATGTETDFVRAKIQERLKKTLGYVAHDIRLSGLLEVAKARLELPSELVAEPEYERISTHMTVGTEARKAARRGDLLALLAVQEIHQIRLARRKKKKRGRKKDPPAPLGRDVHLLRSLKHPHEVQLLRKVYAPGFFLIGIYEPRDRRVAHLEATYSMSRDQAEQLVDRDESEGETFGQRTRDTFELADVFIRADASDVEHQVIRFLDLVFGTTCETPTFDEYCMYLAYAASLRSGSLARQVGASISTKEGDFVVTGANDVPRAGGGLYWPGPEDRRDHIIGEDTNDVQREEILIDTVTRFRPELKKRPRKTQLATARRILKGSRLNEITEYGRAVHAEMETLLGCARVGIPTRGATLFTTTFPCHNCAKHIVDSGVSKVVFVEPYPKSKARELYDDSISIEGTELKPASDRAKPGRAGRKSVAAPPVVRTGERVQFVPFVGVGPRRYIDLFSMRLGWGYRIDRKEEQGGKFVEWRADKNKQPRVPMPPRTYIDQEMVAVKIFKTVEKTRRGKGDQDSAT